MISLITTSCPRAIEVDRATAHARIKGNFILLLGKLRYIRMATACPVFKVDIVKNSVKERGVVLR